MMNFNDEINLEYGGANFKRKHQYAFLLAL